MATLTFELPDDLAAALPGSPGDAAAAIRLAAALFWCSRGELSTGWAVQLAGLSYAGFLEAAARQQVDLFGYTLEEITEQTNRGYVLGRERVADHPAGEGRTR